ncbi:PilZ domain-containing protein [Myxococcota bacterium]
MKTNSSPRHRYEQNRRRNVRYPICVPCTAWVAGTEYGMYWSDNVSMGGALLNAGRMFEEDTPIRLLIHFPWTSAVPVHGTVVHQSNVSLRSRFGVRFNFDVVQTRSLLDRALRLERQPVVGKNGSTVLIMTNRRELWQSIKADVLELGATPMAASRPLDAIWTLTGQADLSATTVLVDYALMGKQILHWFTFLENAFPQAKRALVHDGPVPHGLTNLLVSQRIHALLATPWDHRYLAELVCNDGWREAVLPAAG